MGDETIWWAGALALGLVGILGDLVFLWGFLEITLFIIDRIARHLDVHRVLIKAMRNVYYDERYEKDKTDG